MPPSKKRGPYKTWRWQPNQIPKSTRHSRRVAASNSGSVKKKKPAETMPQTRKGNRRNRREEIEKILNEDPDHELIIGVGFASGDADNTNELNVSVDAVQHNPSAKDNARNRMIGTAETSNGALNHEFITTNNDVGATSSGAHHECQPVFALDNNVQHTSAAEGASLMHNADDNEMIMLLGNCPQSELDDDSWRIVEDDSDEDGDDGEFFLDEECFFSHQNLEPEVLIEEGVPAEDGSLSDSSESDSDEVLDQAPDLHLTINEKIKLLLLLATKQRHKLTYSAAEDILELAGVLAGDELPHGMSKYLMKKAIETYSFGLTEHHVCPSCNKYNGIVLEDSFECGDCSKETDVEANRKEGNIFLHMPLKDQLEKLFSSLPESSLIDTNSREKINKLNYEDIFDGEMWKRLSEEGSGDCITLNFFIDGLQVATTSKQSAWPVMVTVNELPLVLRRKHIMIASLWLSKKKPVLNEYLQPYVSELCELERRGISFRRNGMIVTLKVKACCCISDSIARPMIRNSAQFNGKFGCGLCYHPGFKMQMGKGLTRSYTTRENEYNLRTHEEVMVLAERAELLGIRQKGIKGKSILSKLPQFDVVRCIDLDSFQAVVNVAKRFCNLWFAAPPKNSVVPRFKIHDKLQKVDKRLLAIKPTSEVSRAPRSLTERSDYRGHEWFYFVVIYSVPCLKNVLPARYLNHWALFVKGLAMLMQNSVAKSEVFYADRYLQKFVSGIDTLYGARNVTFSCHLLTHLKRSVMDFAQPFTHSGFLYEGFNHEIKESVKSSNGVAKQIVKVMQQKVAIIEMEEELKVHLSPQQQAYLDKINLRGKILASPHLIIGPVSLLGKPKSCHLGVEISSAIARAGGACTAKTEGNFYERFIVNKEVFHASIYSRVSKKNNTVVLLECGQVFVLGSVVVVNGVCYILGFYYQEEKRKKLCDEELPHMRNLKISPEGMLRCIKPSQILNKVINFTVLTSDTEIFNLAFINVLLMEMLS